MDPLTAATSVVLSVGQLTELTLAILQRVLKAVDGMKNGATYLAMTSMDLGNIIDLVEGILKESALQQESIRKGIDGVRKCAELLEKSVKALEEKSKRENILRKFSYEITRGPVEQQHLTALMQNLTQAKITLLTQIQVAHVGLTSRSNRVVVNVVAVRQVDRWLKSLQDSSGGLLLAEFLKERGILASRDSEVVLSPDDIAELLNSSEADEGPETEVSFTARGLRAAPKSVLLGAPIGDGTPDRNALLRFKHMTVENSTAEDHALLIAAPNSRNTLDAVTKQQLELSRIWAAAPASRAGSM